VNIGSALIGRSGGSQTTIQTVGQGANGIYVNGGTLNISTTLNLGTAAATQSSPTAEVASGLLTVGGTTIVTDNNTRYGILAVHIHQQRYHRRGNSDWWS
jgi:hypothetical protein